MNFESFCSSSSNDSTVDAIALKNLKEHFRTAQVICCVFGITGNLLNLRTLQCPSLQTVPFMYIRALALFDLVSLSGILLHFVFNKLDPNYGIMFYSAYFEAFLINTFLVSGLYCAFLLTIERYLLISRPHIQRQMNPRRETRWKIFLVFLGTFVLHIPMMAQSTIVKENGVLTIGNNKEWLCKEPWWSLYYCYKMSRESLRFLCVLSMTVLNIVIAKKLQTAKKNRRQLLNKQPSVSPHRGSVGNGLDTIQKREFATLLRSFTEKKLTVLMISICFIFILGNVPQIIVMVLQNEAAERLYGFQLYRNTANLLEVVNHCLNFYVFCMASSEYTRAFLLNCLCLRRLFVKCPCCARFLSSRRSSSVGQSINNSIHCAAMREFSSTDESVSVVKESVIRWNQHTQAPIAECETQFCSPRSSMCLTFSDEEMKPPRKGILRKERYSSKDKCLTIANEGALESDPSTSL